MVVLHSLSCARFVSLLVTHSMDGTHSPPSLPITFTSPLVPLYHLFMEWEIYDCVEWGACFCLRKLQTCRVSLPPLFLHYSLSKNCFFTLPLSLCPPLSSLLFDLICLQKPFRTTLITRSAVVSSLQTSCGVLLGNQSVLYVRYAVLLYLWQ